MMSLDKLCFIVILVCALTFNSARHTDSLSAKRMVIAARSLEDKDKLNLLNPDQKDLGRHSRLNSANPMSNNWHNLIKANRRANTIQDNRMKQEGDSDSGDARAWNYWEVGQGEDYYEDEYYGGNYYDGGFYYDYAKKRKMSKRSIAVGKSHSGAERTPKSSA